MQEINPLQAWLDRKQISTIRFAESIGVSKSRIYKFLGGEAENMRFSTAAQIERGTKGEVSMQALAAWLFQEEST